MRYIALFLLLLVIACSKPEEPKKDMEQVTGKYASELEKTACESADKAGNCDRLAGLGFVTVEQCCDRHQKCC
jgi:hypothetical protein